MTEQPPIRQPSGETAAARPSPGGRGRRYVWDPAVRLFHWLLVALVGVSIVTGQIGGLTLMDLHVKSGVAILFLVTFRLMWGLVGSRHARFVSFLRGPAAVVRYAAAFWRGQAAPVAGHNPLGGWAVMLFLVLLAAQAGTGLFSSDDIFTEGPLFHLVDKATSNRLTGYHSAIVTVIYVVIAVHLAAIWLHWRRGENLVPPMIHGRKTADPDNESDNDSDDGAADWRRRWPLAALCLAVAAGAVYWVVTR